MTKQSNRFGNVNPADPFGLVAKKAAGADIDRAHKKAEKPAQKVAPAANEETTHAEQLTGESNMQKMHIANENLDPSSEVAKPEVQTTMLDNDPDFVEVVRERSPLVQRYPTTRVEREETRPAPGFSCAYWSNGLLEMRRGEWIIATFTATEAEYVREFLGKAAA